MGVAQERDGQEAAPAACSCVGIRTCALCCDPALREARGLHRVRAPAGGARRADLRVDGAGALVAHFDDGARVLAAELPVPFTGLFLLPDLVESEAEELALLQELRGWPWQPSQSGRWKQDFGPKANFKKRAVKLPEGFVGFPSFAPRLVGRSLRACAALEGFEPVECLALKYEEERGANHDFHIDDTWLWGPRIVGVTLGSPTVMTFIHPDAGLALRAALPRRSAYVLSGSARYEWQHGILAEDVRGERVAITFRELTEETSASDIGQEALRRARCVAAPKEDASPPGDRDA